MTQKRKRIDLIHEGFYSYASKANTYRVISGRSAGMARAVLVDADNDKEAKTRGANMLKVKPSDIEATQKV